MSWRERGTVAAGSFHELLLFLLLLFFIVFVYVSVVTFTGFFRLPTVNCARYW